MPEKLQNCATGLGPAVKAARGLLGWSQRDLAENAVLAKNTIVRLERDKHTGHLVKDTVMETLRLNGIEIIRDRTYTTVTLRRKEYV